MQKELTAWERGFSSVSLGEHVAKKLQDYMNVHGIKHKSRAVERLLDNRTTTTPPPTPAIPWDDIETVLLEEFGLVNRKKILAVIEKLKAAQQ